MFIVAHGRNGEDGSLQELLELLEVPFTGSDSLASSLCIDKVVTKRLLLRAGLPTPPFQAFSRRTFQDLGAAVVFDDVLRRLGTPLVVKPARLGSSFGIKFVSSPERLRTVGARLGRLRRRDPRRAARRRPRAGGHRAGGAPTGEPRALPIVEILSSPASSMTTRRTTTSTWSRSTPRPRSTPAVAAEVERVSIAAFQTLGCRDFARVDLMLDADERPQILELNTIPGLTETGPTPFAAEAAGMSFAELVAAIARRAASVRS